MAEDLALLSKFPENTVNPAPFAQLSRLVQEEQT
jgi:hypothetical protein